MNIKTHPTFAQVETAQRQAHEAAIFRAVAQVEAARELLDQATESGHKRLDFWREALEHAEEQEARARRAFAQWQRRDQYAARRAFDFSVALFPKTAQRLAKLAAPPTRR